ncbi:hypothetical protein G7Y89_g6111 [Cudoniella acicularis]|uniref:Uncharacterized protein n=1 Tax=Cudoniella acicularis TaxID=354080 RepID=A0A8H4RNC5_9HELO|nr:hypothetical protein G7Y89_g6111 [Cudoniella acicularis]
MSIPVDYSGANFLAAIQNKAPAFSAGDDLITFLQFNEQAVEFPRGFTTDLYLRRCEKNNRSIVTEDFLVPEETSNANGEDEANNENLDMSIADEINRHDGPARLTTIKVESNDLEEADEETRDVNSYMDYDRNSSMQAKPYTDSEGDHMSYIKDEPCSDKENVITEASDIYSYTDYDHNSSIQAEPYTDSEYDHNSSIKNEPYSDSEDANEETRYSEEEEDNEEAFIKNEWSEDEDEI